MTTSFDTLDDYERTLSRRSARAKLLWAVAAFLFVSAIVGLRAYKLVRRLNRAAPAPVAVVRVSGDGALSVDGCAKSVSACLADAENAGAETCRVVIARAATDAANADAIRACNASHMRLSLSSDR